jgi:hypothetical protein
MNQLTMLKEPIESPLAEVPMNPMTLLDNAIKGGADIGVIERMSALVERWQANAAQVKYADAIAAFQNEMPPIHKSRKADRFKFAGFDDILRVAQPLLSRHGISLAFDSAHSEKQIEVTVRVRVGGYFEDRKFTVPVPMSLKVSEPQQYGAALQYAKRYAMCAALNIVVTDEDDENKIGRAITSEQINELLDLMQKAGTNEKKVCVIYGIESLDQLNQQTFAAAKNLMNQKIAAKSSEAVKV